MKRVGFENYTLELTREAGSREALSGCGFLFYPASALVRPSERGSRSHLGECGEGRK